MVDKNDSFTKMEMKDPLEKEEIEEE